MNGYLFQQGKMKPSDRKSATSSRTPFPSTGLTKVLTRVKKMARDQKVGDHTPTDEPGFRNKVACLETQIAALLRKARLT
jgi:hypothetical protein